MKSLLPLLPALLLVVLTGCDNRAGMFGPDTRPLPTLGTPDTNIPTDPPITVPPSTFAMVIVPDTALDAGVPWDLYGEELQVTLAGMALGGDCKGLRREFSEAYGRGDVKDVALLTYIDTLLRVADCL